MKVKAVPANFKVNRADRTISGYASVFGTVDLAGEVVMLGAFKDTLAERLPVGKVRYLWQHDPGSPVGLVTEAKEDDTGLWIKASIAKTARGDELLALIENGAISEQSFGYDVLEAGEHPELKTADGKPARSLIRLKLWEVSAVTFGANDQTTIRIGTGKAMPMRRSYTGTWRCSMSGVKVAPGELAAGDFVEWMSGDVARVGKVMQVASAPAEGMPDGLAVSEEDPAAQITVYAEQDAGGYAATTDSEWVLFSLLTKIEPLAEQPAQPAPDAEQPAEGEPPAGSEDQAGKTAAVPPAVKQEGAPPGYRPAPICETCAGQTAQEDDTLWCNPFQFSPGAGHVCPAWGVRVPAGAQPPAAEQPPATGQQAASVPPSGQKVGRVLSGKNYNRIKDARDLLVQVMQEADKTPADETAAAPGNPDQGKSNPGSVKEAPLDEDDLLAVGALFAASPHS